MGDRRSVSVVTVMLLMVNLSSVTSQEPTLTSTPVPNPAPSPNSTAASTPSTSINCTTPTNISNGDYSPKGVTSYPYNTSITFTCNTGYSLKGTNNSICQNNSEWSNSQPTCAPKNCTTPENISNGDYSPRGVTSYPYKISITFTCNTGYSLEGSNNSICKSNSEWSNSQPACYPKNCTTPENISNGDYSPKGVTNYPYNIIITFTCNTGYSLEGSNNSICKSNSEWSNSQPACYPKNCTTPENISNGDYSPRGVTSYPYNIIITFTCNTGYSLEGSNNSICKSNSEWSNSQPVCYPKNCTTPENISNGDYSPRGVTSYPYNIIITFTCNTGYSLEGSNNSICKSNSEWSNSQPACYPKNCTTPENISNGDYSPRGVTSYPYNIIITFTCNTGYSLEGSNNSICKSNSEWSNSQPACYPKNCTALANVMHATTKYTDVSGKNITGGNKYPYLTKATIKCDAGYYVENDESQNTKSYERNCNATPDWSGGIKRCILRVLNYNESCDADGPDKQCNYINSDCNDEGKCVCSGNLVYNRTTPECVERVPPHLTVNSRTSSSLTLNIVRGNEQGANFSVCNTNKTECQTVTGNVTGPYKELQSASCYTFTVKVDNDPKASNSSSSICTNPSQPLEVDKVKIGSFKTSIQWKFQGDYDRLEVNNTLTGANMSFTIDDVASSSFESSFGTISGLTPSTDYAVQLVAVKHKIYGIPSTALSFCTYSDKPKTCTCSQRTNSSVHLKWTNGTGPYKQFNVNNLGKGKNFESDEELTPGEMKSFSITSVPTCENVIRQSHPCIVNVTALPPDPTNVVIENTTNTRVNITWNKKNGDVDSYDIVVKHINGNIFKKYNTTGQSTGQPLPITGLAPATKYTVEVRSIRMETETGGCEDDDEDKTLYSVNNASGTFHTRPNAPTGPLNIENVNETGFTVKWQEPSSNYSYYHVVVQTDRSESDTHKQNTTKESLSSGYYSVPFDGLTPGRLYTIKVYTVLEGLMSEQAAEDSSYTVPTMPDFIQIKEINFTRIVFTMNRLDAEFIEWHVHVKRSGFNNISTFSNSTTIGIVTGLSPGTDYSIEYYVSVTGHNSKKTEPTMNYTETPGVKPSSVIINATTPESLTITWSPPSVGDPSAYTYNVTFSCKSPNGHRNTTVDFQMVNSTNASVNSLDPGSKCNVLITTIIGNQTSAARTEKQLEQTTNETEPGTVREIKTMKIQPTSFVISWKDPTIRNGVIRRYDLLIARYIPGTCEPGDPDNANSVECIRRIVYNCTGCTPVPSNDIQDRQVDTQCADSNQHTFSKDQTDFNHTIADLHPYMYYNVTIIPYTVINGVENSTIQLTAEDKPTEPPQNLTVTSTTAESIELSWKPPSCGKRNGNITQFKVFAHYKPHVCTDSVTSLTQSETETKHVQGDNTTTKLEGLYSFWDYQITIQASTVKGSSNMSHFIDQRTNNSVPSEVLHLNVTEISTESLDIEWTQPCYPNGIVNNYTIVTTNLDNNKTMSTNSTNNNTQFQISPLLPYRNYTVVVRANVIGYQGNESSPLNVTTSIGLPDIPKFVNATSVTSSIIYVEWNVTKYTGPTTFYVKAIASDAEHKDCSPGTNFHARTCNVTDLLPYKNYTITIEAETGAGSSLAGEERIIQTLQAEPGNVTNLHVLPQKDVLLPRSIYVEWDPPHKKEQNGILIGYVIEAQAKVRIGEYKTFQRCIINETTASRHCETHKINVTCIKSDINTTAWTCNMTNGVKTGDYILVVSAITAPGNGSKSYQDTTVPPGAPLKPEETPSKPLVKSAETSVSEPEYQISVAFAREFLCGTENGDIVEWGVVVSEESKVIGDAPFIGTKDLFERHKRSYKTWSQVYGEDVDMLPYIASPERWRPCDGSRRKRSTTERSQSPVTFIAGENSGCSESASKQTCNGKLVPGKKYRVKAYVCTDGGCTETKYSAPISTDKLTPIALIVGVVMAILVVLIVIGVTVLLKRRQMFCFAKKMDEEGRTHRSEPPTSGAEMKEISKSSSLFKKGPVKIADFPSYCDRLYRDSKMLFGEAYKLLREESPTPAMTAAEKQSNRPKNRYTNILAFDQSRVKLLPMDDDEDSDYINANYIPGYTSRREYIATQGPLPATLNDFWRMIWEQNVDTIVMVTKEVEKGRRKCERYWPDLNEPCYYGDLVVCVQSESHLSDYTIRVIEVKLKAARRIVRHFHYLKWPDMGCPDEPSYLINFVKAVRDYSKTETSGKSPMVVHCSAGVGRTGTFLAVDYLLQYVRDHDDIDIYKLVLEMRNHRSNMVQTEDQYVYIHECMREFITTDEDDEEDEDEEPTYANTGIGNEENVYENTAFSADM